LPPVGEVVQCQWQNGVFVPIGVGNPLERAAAATAVDDAFLRCVDAVTAQIRSASPNKGNTYAPTVFEQMPEATGFNRKALAGSPSHRVADMEAHHEVAQTGHT
jgi:hypothetical protein